ncbi:MAG: sugar phosphate isomerase/epimerase [Microbacteriaceae bacterium]|nr:MAG: sugar phosphate isomerase/epimerase [Microbacteriaceae bacterium]
MKIGMVTACFPDLSLHEVAAWAAGAGYEALEVAAWPSVGGREFEASHIAVSDPAALDSAKALIADLRLEISALAYYENNLHPDLARQDAIHAHLKSVVDAASSLGVPYVGTFIGRDWTKTVSENLVLAERYFRPLVDYAGERRVSIIIENCVMEGWHPDGYPGNLAYSPELWEWMFDLGLYLNFDPSHLLWMGIDPIKVLSPYISRVPHAQAKDIELFKGRRNRYGWPGKAIGRATPWDVGWWRYRIPGLGQVDWRRYVDLLYEGGFNGVLSVEHEDPVWSGSEDRVKTGLGIALRTLRPLVVSEGEVR